MGQVIAISGTPGTGKSAVGRKLAQRLDVEAIELGQIVKEQQFYTGEDPDRNTLIADIDRLQDYLANLIRHSEKRIIVSGHFADLVPDEFMEILVVLRCHPITLIDRLRNRQWSTTKILENIQAEILGECTSQSLAHHTESRIFEIDTTTQSAEEVSTTIEEILKKAGEQYAVGTISWLRSLDPQLIHEIMEENRLPESSHKA